MLEDLSRISSLLARSCAESLGEPANGAIAYIRCLDAQTVESLITSDFAVAGWSVYAVGASRAGLSQIISADEAVDIRERKESATILLVIANECGAGMDGIYSAAREITEKELLSTARKFAEDGLSPAEQENARVAVQRAKRTSMRRPVSLWQELLFYDLGAYQGVGPSLWRLGLWPIVTINSAKEDIELSAQLAERLLNGTASRPVSEILGSLMLQEPSENQLGELRDFLHYVGRSAHHECMERLQRSENLWLGNLRPGFMGTSLADLEIVPWRGSDGFKIHKWSGLDLNGTEDRPVFVIDHEAPSKFRIRWKAKPETLEPNSVVYLVSIVTTSDEELLPEKSISHKAKNVQECTFATDEFGELESGGKWVAKVTVRALRSNGEVEGEEYLIKETEEFVVAFGARDESIISSSVGSEVRALSEVAVQLPSDEVDTSLEKTQEDGKGYIILRGSSRYGRVRRLPLVKISEESWRDHGFMPGRWKVRINADGIPYGAPEFIPVDIVCLPASQRAELQTASLAFGQKIMARHGIFGTVLSGVPEIEPYLRASLNAWRYGAPSLALCHTIEVVSLSDKSIGLIVLPTHPSRVAWHYAYDALVNFQVRKTEESPAMALEILRKLDGSFVPLFLPPLHGRDAFVYGDSVGFFCSAMVQATDPEPQASISLMAQALAAGEDSVSRTCGGSISSAISREIHRYIKLHPSFESLRIAALRSGDALIITRALGEALAFQKEGALSTDSVDQDEVRSRFLLDLYSSEPVRKSSLRVVGRFISEMTARRRSGAGAPAERDRWAQESCKAVNGLILPRLSWAKRADHVPHSHVHLSVAFDMFVPTMELDKVPSRQHAWEVYGLCPTIIREYQAGATSEWNLTGQPASVGLKHPAGEVYTDLILETHDLCLQQVSKALGGSAEQWPVLKTQVTDELRDTLQILHEKSDWVISVGNNGGVEFFDSPQDDPETYDTFIIDLVPERADLQGLQLVTSTSKLDEVKGLLETALRQMGLSSSARNCTFLLTHLKGLSGRLAMRLTSESSKQELIALALVRSSCMTGPKEVFPDLSEGFFVPLDDLAEMGPTRAARGRVDSGRRADLLYISGSEEAGLSFTFVEVKFRVNLPAAKSEGTLRDIQQQTANSRVRWKDSFFQHDSDQLSRLLSQRRLAHILRFYLDKARRHGLREELFHTISSAVDRLLADVIDFDEQTQKDLGFVFCPDFDGIPELIDESEQTRIYLIGSSQLPDRGTIPSTMNLAFERGFPKQQGSEVRTPESSVHAQPSPVSATGELESAGTQHAELSRKFDENDRGSVGQEGAEFKVSLGDATTWTPSIRGNPHLLVVGKSGMGKSHAVTRIIRQLVGFGVRPVVFDFHGDLQSSISATTPGVHFLSLLQGLGFNPLAIVDDNPHSYLNNSGQVRDIFAGVFPEMGDVQLEAIRSAIKQSYQEVGFGGDKAPKAVPDFARFFEIIRSSARPPRGLIERLEELSDYGLFQSNRGPCSVLEYEGPVVIDLHSIQNDSLQSAFASFQLFNIYQSMFRLGPASSIRHLVVFDEAHRASKLKLVPLLAKESRKYGIALLLASQEVRDFHPSVFANVGNFLVLGVNEPDAKVIAKYLPVGGDVRIMTERFKALNKYHAYFIGQNGDPKHLRLSSS